MPCFSLTLLSNIMPIKNRIDTIAKPNLILLVKETIVENKSGPINEVAFP